MLFRSKHLSYFQQHGEIFAYHDMFGYLLGMSRDLVDLLQFHDVTLREREEVDERFGDQFEAEQLDEFIGVFKLFSCLIESELAEERQLWSMVAARSRWVVYHQPSPTELVFWRTDRSGNSFADPVEPWAARLWASVDGETTLEDLFEEVADDPTLKEHEDPRKHVVNTLKSWVHHDRQYLKFAKAPLSKFGAEHAWPSYLRSSMPYPPFRPGVDPDPHNPLEDVAVPINPPHAYYEGEIEDADEQFRDVETTLSHLFRQPSPLLQGESYTDRVVAYLVETGRLGESTRTITEVGAGTGAFASGVLSRLRDDHPAIYDAVAYTIVDLSPVLREKQKESLTTADVVDKVAWVAANAETHEFEPNSIDLLLCNEVVGDFTTVKLTRELLGLQAELEPETAYEGWTDKTVERLGPSGRLIREHTLPLRDAPEEFYLNVGAIDFIERVNTGLSSGGSAFITEYGDLMAFPVASTQLDHIEFSIQFKQLHHTALSLGLEASVEYVQDLIKLDREAYTLVTTRTWFASMRAMLLSFGINFDKVAYSRDMFEELLGDALNLSDIGDVRFKIVDERCMGLAPHEFKALMLKKA